MALTPRLGLFVQGDETPSDVEQHQPGAVVPHETTERLGGAHPDSQRLPDGLRLPSDEIGLACAERRAATAAPERDRAPGRVTHTQHRPELVVEAQGSHEPPVARAPLGVPRNRAQGRSRTPCPAEHRTG
jgi:hypothetical protein